MLSPHLQYLLVLLQDDIHSLKELEKNARERETIKQTRQRDRQTVRQTDKQTEIGLPACTIIIRDILKFKKI